MRETMSNAFIDFIGNLINNNLLTILNNAGMGGAFKINKPWEVNMICRVTDKETHKQVASWSKLNKLEDYELNYYFSDKHVVVIELSIIKGALKKSIGAPPIGKSGVAKIIIADGIFRNTRGKCYPADNTSEFLELLRIANELADILNSNDTNWEGLQWKNLQKEC